MDNMTNDIEKESQRLLEDWLKSCTCGKKISRNTIAVGIEISSHPAHAGDQQTARTGDFSIAELVYHVTATPGRNVIQKCAENLKAGAFPILLVPKSQEYKAIALAQDEGVDQEISIISIEDLVAMNIIELAIEENVDFF